MRYLINFHGNEVVVKSQVTGKLEGWNSKNK
jgi:hypothetical protein